VILKQEDDKIANWEGRWELWALGQAVIIINHKNIMRQ
jgi:hypothetical protein